MLNSLTHVVKHARFNLAQAVVLNGKSFVASLVTKKKTEAASGGRCVPEAMNSTVEQETLDNRRAYRSTTIFLLSALRARHCCLTYVRKCWQSTWLTKPLCRKFNIAYKTLLFQDQRESSGCGAVVLEFNVLHVGMMFIRGVKSCRLYDEKPNQPKS